MAEILGWTAWELDQCGRRRRQSFGSILAKNKQAADSQQRAEVAVEYVLPSLLRSKYQLGRNLKAVLFNSVYSIGLETVISI